MMLAASHTTASCSSLGTGTCSSAFRALRRPCTGMRSLAAAPRCSTAQRRGQRLRLHAYKVEIEHENGTSTLEVGEDETILECALDNGLELSHDCKMGVCMTCPAKLVEGSVDQSAGMLDDSVKDKGYALLCVSQPTSDCKIRTIEEDELLEQVLHGG